jgi:FkbM family methyltransferase
LRSLVEAELRPGILFVDCGAHVGLFSALAARRGARVIALEADPYNAAALRRNVAGLDVRVLEKAVSDRVGRADFHAFAGTISGSLVDRADRPRGRTVPVELTALDAELAGEDAAAALVVKLDVEGAEPRALAGMRETIARAARLVLVVEANPQALAAAGSGPEELVALLLGHALECAFVDERARRLEPVTAPAELRKGNLLCRKPASGR